MSYFKRFLIFALSALLIIAPPMAYAASPNGWSIQSSYMQGATAVIDAAKQGFRSSITHLPSATNVGKELVKVGGGLAVAYAMSQLLDAGVDWVMDAENNRVRYIDKKPLPDSYLWVGNNGTVSGATADAACSAFKPVNGYTHHHTEMHGDASARCFAIHTPTGNVIDNFGVERTVVAGGVDETPKYIPISTVAQKVISNATAGHEPSKQLIKTVAIADFNVGTLDTELEAKAKPSDEPFNPDDTVPFDPSSIIAAIQSLKSTIDNLASDLKAKINSLAVSIGIIDGKVDDIAAEQQRTMQVINDGMADVVAANNATGARVGDVVAAIEALEGNMLDGKVINDAIDRAIAAGHTDTASIVAAIEAIEGNTLDGQVINDAIDRLIANDNINAQTAADAKTASDAAQTAADVANTTAVTDAIDAAAVEAKEAADAKAAADAAALEWAKEAPEAPTDTGVVVDEPISDFDSDKSYITFTGSCPPKYTASLSIMGATAPFEFDYTPICTVMSYLKPFIVGAGYIAAAYIIAGHSRGSKD